MTISDNPLVTLIESVSNHADRISAQVDAIPTAAASTHESLCAHVRAAQAAVEDMKATIMMAGDPDWTGEAEAEADAARERRFEEGLL